MQISNETIIAVANAITANANALKSVVDALPHEAQTKVAAQVVHVTAAPAPVQAPIATPVPNVQVAPVSVIPTNGVGSQSPVNAMPAPPTFTTPAPAPAQGAPFTDAKGMLEWLMATYKALGAAKGAGIQGVLSSLGYANVNDVRVEDYAALYAGVESLKA